MRPSPVAVVTPRGLRIHSDGAAMGQDYYAVLELGRNATDADIKKA